MAIASSATPLVASVLNDMSSDHTGADTFHRYKWQAKQAVWRWLACLGEGEDAPTAIACELVEDLVVMYPTRLVFAQLKTKTKGSWSDLSVCGPGHGLDSLIRAYNTVRSTDVADVSTYELWLEGPAAATKATTLFFDDPKRAGNEVRARLVKLGLKKSDSDDFLKRLQVRPQQPSQAHIDAVILQYIGALWPSMTGPERDELYSTLLVEAEVAQTNMLHFEAFTGHLVDELFPPAPVDDFTTGLANLTSSALTRQMLLSLTPPLVAHGREELLRRLRQGESASALELKMRAAGGKSKTIADAQALRATADVQRLRLLASRDNAAVQLETLEAKILGFAEAHATSARLASAGNPAIAAMPAERVFAEIRMNPGNLLALDVERLFGGNSDDILGYLCHLSDACKFWWRVE